MKSKKLAGLGLLTLSVGIIACAPQTPTLTPMATALVEASRQETFVPRPGHAIVSLVIRWPQAIGTQAIPEGTDRIVVTLKSGETQIGRKEVSRGTAATETVEFDLNPKIGIVNVAVEAFIGQNLVAQGGTSLTLRDNSVAYASVILDPELTVSNDEALAFLSDPSRFNHWGDYLAEDNLRGRDLGIALRSVSSGFPALGYPNFMTPPAGATAEQSPLQFLRFQSLQGAVDLENSEIKALYWPGYRAGVTLSTAQALRTLQVDLAPDSKLQTSSEASVGTLKAEVTASSWLSDPRLITMGQFLSSPTGATSNGAPSLRPVVMLGGQTPASNSVSLVKLSGSFTPNGATDKKVTATLEASQFQNMASAAGFQQFFESLGWSSWPTVFSATLDSPDLKTANLKLGIRPDLTGTSLKGVVELRDDKGQMHKVALDAQATMNVYMTPYGLMPRDLGISFTAVDHLTNLRIVGTFNQSQENLGESTVKLHAKFYNHVTSKLIGSVDFEQDANGQMTRLTDFPVLKLYPDQGDPTEILMTPGYFMGDPDADGSFSIWVR